MGRNTSISKLFVFEVDVKTVFFNLRVVATLNDTTLTRFVLLLGTVRYIYEPSTLMLSAIWDLCMRNGGVGGDIIQDCIPAANRISWISNKPVVNDGMTNSYLVA